VIRKVKTIRICRRCRMPMFVWSRFVTALPKRVLCPACVDLEVLRLKEENYGKANG